MSCCRQNANIFWWLFKHPIWFLSKWKVVLTGGYLMQDSFYTHWNRIFGCREKHKKPDNNENFCFACYRELKGAE